MDGCLRTKIGMEGYNSEYNAITSEGAVELYIFARSLASLRISADSSVSKTVGDSAQE